MAHLLQRESLQDRSITEVMKKANKEIIQIVQQRADSSDLQRDKLCRELQANEQLLIELNKTLMSRDLTLIKTKVQMAKLQIQMLDQTKRITQLQQDSAIQGKKVKELQKKMQARRRKIVQLRKRSFKVVKDEMEVENSVKDEGEGPNQGPEEVPVHLVKQ